MYSNDQTEIRHGFVNFIGAILQASPFKGKAAKQNVIAILQEESLKIAQDEQNLYDLYALKPLFRAVNVVLKQRVNELSKLPKQNSVSKKIEEYNTIIKFFDDLIETIK